MSMPTEQELIQTWNNDSKFISESDIVIALDSIPKLHAKYGEYLLHYTNLAHEQHAAYSKYRKMRFQYYRGDLNADPETLKQYGWVPLQKKIDASHIKEHLDGDDKLVQMKCIIDQTIALAEYCKGVISALNARGYGLQAKAKWKMFLVDGSE